MNSEIIKVTDYLNYCQIVSHPSLMYSRDFSNRLRSTRLKMIKYLSFPEERGKKQLYHPILGYFRPQIPLRIVRKPQVPPVYDLAFKLSRNPLRFTDHLLD